MSISLHLPQWPHSIHRRDVGPGAGAATVRTGVGLGPAFPARPVGTLRERASQVELARLLRSS